MKSKNRQFIKRLITGLKFITRLFISRGSQRFDPIIYDPPSRAPNPTVFDEPGAFSVKRFKSTFRNQDGRYPVTVYFPVCIGVHPAVAFSPGLGAVRQWYQWIGEHLASHGYIVLIFTVPIPLFADTIQQEAGFVTALEFLKKENENSSSTLFGAIDTEKRAIMGHSLGGAAALAAANKMDVQAVISLAPAPVLDDGQLEDIMAPTQIQVGSFDTIAGEKTAISFYNSLNAKPRQLITLNGANHLDFHDVDSVAFTGGNRMDHPATVDTVNYSHRLSGRYFTAWLDRFLKGDTSVEEYLFGSDALQNLASKQLAVLQFEGP